ncbi:hypothetical protein [Hugenholtzia roseola]|uniref:hypothetical protein n=1 Tax=Hugenholtzia roseola TaxID=1002 RepID=UPI0003FF8012|nr:hypothetical protein [Hugenholtzia roseola]
MAILALPSYRFTPPPLRVYPHLAHRLYEGIFLNISTLAGEITYCDSHFTLLLKPISFHHQNQGSLYWESKKWQSYQVLILKQIIALRQLPLKTLLLDYSLLDEPLPPPLHDWLMQRAWTMFADAGLRHLAVLLPKSALICHLEHDFALGNRLYYSFQTKLFWEREKAITWLEKQIV